MLAHANWADVDNDFANGLDTFSTLCVNTVICIYVYICIRAVGRIPVPY